MAWIALLVPDDEALFQVELALGNIGHVQRPTTYVKHFARQNSYYTRFVDRPEWLRPFGPDKCSETCPLKACPRCAFKRM